MLILAIETATAQVGVAVGGHEGVLGLFEVQRDKRHAETLTPAIEFVCRNAVTHDLQQSCVAALVRKTEILWHILDCLQAQP